MKKQLLIYIVLSVTGIFILNLLVNIGEMVYITGTAYIFIQILFVVFGMLIEWRKILSIIKSGVKINLLIIPSIILLLIAFLPLSFSISVYNIFLSTLNLPIISPLLTESTRSVIFVFTGIILVRSLTKKN